MISTTEKRIFWLISTIGHPVLLVSVFTILVNYNEFQPQTAAKLSLAVVGFVVVPICIYILVKMRRGEYRNFDVSERKNRNSLYPVILLFQFLLLIFITAQNYSWLIKAGLLSSIFLIGSAFFINRILKVSLHTSIAFYLAVLLIQIKAEIAFVTIIFALMIGWSRVMLQRHSVPEILVGFLLGISSGVIFHLLLTIY
jgi:membrane-associated phospholipid phosphatase